MSDFEHRLGHALEGFHQRVAQFGVQARQTETEQYREEDDRQHLTASHGREDVRWNQVEDGLDKRMFMRDFSCRGCVLGNIDRAQGAHVDPGTGLEHVGQHQADQDRDGGDHLEVNDGFKTDTTEFLRISHACNPDNQ